jgi:hypothetical protein
MMMLAYFLALVSFKGYVSARNYGTSPWLSSIPKY